MSEVISSKTASFEADLARLLQIQRAHDSARPTRENPAWLNSHNDETFLLSFIDKLWTEYSRTLQERDRLMELAMDRGARQ